MIKEELTKISVEEYARLQNYMAAVCEKDSEAFLAKCQQLKVPLGFAPVFRAEC